MALPGQQTLMRRDLYGLRPTPLGSTNQNSRNRRPLVVPNLRRPNSVISENVGRSAISENLRRPNSAISETLQNRMASAAEAAAARARVNKRA